MICPKCHCAVRESDSFCGHCGCFLGKAGQGKTRSGLSSQEEQEGMLDKFIGVDGRINRKKYIFRSLFLWGMGFIFELCVIMGRVEQSDFMAGDLPGMVLFTIVGIPWMMLMVRRLHDLNRNGFWSLCPLLRSSSSSISAVFVGRKGETRMERIRSEGKRIRRGSCQAFFEML